MKCIHCGALVPDTARFCPECGKKIEQKRLCPSCHAEIKAEDKYCMQCGASLQVIHNEEEKSQNKKEVQETVAVRCPQCGKIVSEDEKKCPACGMHLKSGYSGPSVNLVQCPSCGATISDMNRVCPECGCRLSGNIAKQVNSPVDEKMGVIPEPKSQSRHSILIVTILCILILFLVVFIFLRNKPLRSSQELQQSPEIEQVDMGDYGAEQDVDIQDEEPDRADDDWQKSDKSNPE